MSTSHGVPSQRVELDSVTVRFSWRALGLLLVAHGTLFVGDDEGLDQDATVEWFMIVAGLSSIASGTIFNLPFVVAPSVLYAAREAGMTVGGHLAAQVIANLLAAAFLAQGLKLGFATFIPTSLRLGAGCGISMLVSVLGLRSLGLLAASEPFTLQPFTWRSIVGLAVVTIACGEASNPSNKVKKWLCAVAFPVVFTLLVYATTDRTKFEEFPSDKTPLSNWRDGSLGIVNFSEIWDAPGQHCFYIVSMFLSITVNVSSILLVLVDAVCLEFRAMACTIPLMSCLGNLLGVTTQAAFVETLILVYVGGKTGLGTAVTGVLLILSIVLRPLLPILTPGHVSGALTVIISLRYFTVIRRVDITLPSNLLMFGMSILLIPFSFDFVDAVCLAAVLGFLCQAVGVLAALLWGAWCGTRNKVAVSSPEVECETQSGATFGYRHVDGELQRSTGTHSTSVDNQESIVKEGALRSQLAAPRNISHTVNLNSAPASPTPMRRQSAPTSPFHKYETLRHGHERAVPSKMQPLDPNKLGLFMRLQAWFSTHNHSSTAPAEKSMQTAEAAPAAPPADPVAVHWALALVATLELVLSAISDRNQDDEE